MARSECTKIARFSAAAAAIFTAPRKIARLFDAPRCAISSAKKIASEPRFFLRRKRVKMVLAAEFPAIPSSAVKIASEWRYAILVHSGRDALSGRSALPQNGEMLPLGTWFHTYREMIARYLILNWVDVSDLTGVIRANRFARFAQIGRFARLGNSSDSCELA